MSAAITETLQLVSTVKSSGELELSLRTAELGPLGSNDVIVRVEASPINPSDLGMLFGLADMREAKAGERNGSPVVTAPIAEKLLPNLSGRFDQPMPVGNEGAGVVVAAGDDAEAQALIGKTVAILGGGMYAQYRRLPAKTCLLLNDGTTAEQGASCFVNPLTALGMVETMRDEGHKALVHTAAASNLGQMLQRICLADDVPLVNVVRKDEQADLLRDLGATHVVNSSAPSFMADLVDALAATGATIAFDATGGGALAGQILTAMEAALVRTGEGYSRYGSTTHKQVYIYGGLDRAPTTLNRNYGMAWGIGGWLLTPFLQKIGPAHAERLRRRVADEINSTFASSYTRKIALGDVLSLESIAEYGRQATGKKYLVLPNA